MSAAIAAALRTVALGCAAVGIGTAAIWGGFALWYQLPGGRSVKALAVAPWAAFSSSVLMALWQGRIALALSGFAPAFAALLLWWMRLRPSNDQEWADEVAQITHGRVDGNRVTLHNVRNFDWRTLTDYTEVWETRSYDLELLRSVDMILSYWSGPAIAHMLISFGFEGGDQVVFSVEIRRQKTQVYSSLGGFFKEFELSIIAADELDAIRVRTNVRGEDVYLYRLQLSREAMRLLFLGYVSKATALVNTPRFYNTITVNCTTLVFQMVKRIVGHLPLDYRLLFSGYLPSYVYRVGGLDRRVPLEELRARGRITLRAQESERGECSSDHGGEPGSEHGGEPSSERSGKSRGEHGGEPSNDRSGEHGGEPSSERSGMSKGEHGGEPSNDRSGEPSGDPNGMRSGDPGSKCSSEHGGEPSTERSGIRTGESSSRRFSADIRRGIPGVD